MISLKKAFSQHSIRNSGRKFLFPLNFREAHNFRNIVKNTDKNALVSSLLKSYVNNISNLNRINCYSSSIIRMTMNTTSSSSTSSSTNMHKDGDDNNKLDKKSRKEKLQEGATNFMSMAKAYGPVFVGFYF